MVLILYKADGALLLKYFLDIIEFTMKINVAALTGDFLMH